jgi:hypothetical protein
MRVSFLPSILSSFFLSFPSIIRRESCRAPGPRYSAVIRECARATDAAAAMALSKLSGDEQGIILGQLRNTLEPRLAMNFSSASTELRALLTPAVRQQLT